ncbi:hypothetical protein K439DRAFT_1373826, partial [Ramaria rubella]
VARMQETGDPCRMPLTTGMRSSRMPSRHTAACRSSKNEAIHWTIFRGMPFCRMTLRRRE